MCVSHGYSTMGGIEYDDGGYVEKTTKGESLTSTRLINELWRCPSIDVNARSRDCHATDALELRMLNKRKLVGVHPTGLLMKTQGILRKPIVGIYKPSSIMKNSH